MKKVHVTVLSLIIFLLVWPLNMAAAVVENSYVKLALIFITTLLVTTGFLLSHFGLKHSMDKYTPAAYKSGIFFMLLGGLGLVFHTFLYVYFVIFGLAVLGSANTWLGLLTFVLVIIVPIGVGYKYKLSGIRTVKNKPKA